LGHRKVIVELDPFRRPAKAIAGREATSRVAIRLQAVKPPLDADPRVEPVRAAAAFEAILAGREHQILLDGNPAPALANEFDPKRAATARALYRLCFDVHAI